VKRARRQPTHAECRALAARIDAYLEGDLEPQRAASVRAHLRDCQECARLAVLAEKSLRAMRSLPRVAVKPEVTARILRAVAAERRGFGVTEAEALVRLRALPRLRPSDTLHARILAVVAPEAERRQARLCRLFARRVEALLDGELPEGLARGLRGHADRCPACGLVLRQARAGRAALAGVRRLAPSSDHHAQVRAAVGAEMDRRRSAWPAMPLAAALATCALLLVAAATLPVFRGPVATAPAAGPSVASTAPGAGDAVTAMVAAAGEAAVEQIPWRAPSGEPKAVGARTRRSLAARRAAPRYTPGPSERAVAVARPQKNGAPRERDRVSSVAVANQSAAREQAVAVAPLDLAPGQTGIGSIESMTLML